jgi:hypothetical protein
VDPAIIMFFAMLFGTSSLAETEELAITGGFKREVCPGCQGRGWKVNDQ